MRRGIYVRGEADRRGDKSGGEPLSRSIAARPRRAITITNSPPRASLSPSLEPLTRTRLSMYCVARRGREVTRLLRSLFSLACAREIC